jgi:hypothetical protein
MSFESGARPTHSLIVRASPPCKFAPSSTRATVCAADDMIKLIRSTTPLDARCTSVRCA